MLATAERLAEARCATEAEALANIQDAITEYLAARDELLRGAEVREVEVAA